MDRQIVYPGSIPLDTDPLNMQRNSLVGLSKLAAAMLGTSTVVNGLACVPTSPASLQVYVNPGEIYSLQNLDSTAYGSLAADTAHQIVKQGILLDQATLNCPAPGTAGQSINYLVQATFQESDTTPVTLPYYNSSNPSTAWSGPSNSGTAQNTKRQDLAVVAVKAGTAATTGTQTTPAPDSGYVGLWVVTVANGQATITAGNITAYNGAPVLPASLLAMIQQAPVIVGGARNVAMAVAAASATATLTADEIVVETTLGGNVYKIPNFSKSINLGTTGAGGMDVGSAPTSGYVAIYAIYNPTTGASALLAVNATSAVAPSVYGGANLPAGYTASALVSVWPTDGTGKFKVGTQLDRQISLVTATALNTNTSTGAVWTSLSVSSIVPKNAKSIGGTLAPSNSSSASQNTTMAVASDSSGSGSQTAQYALTSSSGGGITTPFASLAVPTAQTIWYQTVVTAGTPTYQISISSYTF